jgi:hypothetical protein
MANKKYTDFSAGTYDTAKIFLQADATTGDLEKVNLPTIPTLTPTQNELISAYQAMGSEIKAQVLGWHIMQATAAFGMISGQIYCIPVWLANDATITGAIHYQRVQGNFTAANNNLITLSTYSGGTLTEVKTTGNISTLWKATGNTFVKTPFTSTLAATAGLYFIQFLYCNSAEVAQPILVQMPTALATQFPPLDLTNSAKILSVRNGQTNVTTPVAMSNFSAVAITPWIGLY